MIHGHVHRQLSAYLDGQAKHPERIARHLAACPRCARRFEELRLLSDGLRALPAPESNESRTQAILAACQVTLERKNTERLPDFSARRPLWLAPALAAAGLLLVLGAGFLLRESVPSGDREPSVANTVWADDEAVVEELTLLAAAGADLSEYQPQSVPDLPETGEITLDELFWTLAEESPELSALPYPGQDMVELVDALAPGEAEEFEALLRNYLEGGTLP